jgi:hypothetical protein
MAPLVSSTSSLAAHAALRSAVQAPSPQAQLAALQKEYRALGPDGPSTVAAARQDGVGCTDDRTDLEVEREAERVVKAHFGLLHSYNEVRDAVEVRLAIALCAGCRSWRRRLLFGVSTYLALTEADLSLPLSLR